MGGTQIRGEQILDSSITSVDLQDGSIIQSKIDSLRPVSNNNNTIKIKAGILKKKDGTGVIKFSETDTSAFDPITTNGNTRYDLVGIDTIGTVSIVKGAEGNPGSVPPYPQDKFIIAEIKIDETSNVVISDQDITDVRSAFEIDNPNFILQGDTYISINDTGDGYISCVEDGTEVIRINNSNVGIGVNNPVAKLDISGQIKIADGTQGAGKVLTSDTNGFASWQTFSVTPGGSNTQLQFNNNGSFGGANIFYDPSTGKTGFGINNPTASLDVRNTSGDLFNFYSNSILRSNLDTYGRQSWYLNSGTGEAGKITYSTPSGYPGIIFYNGATYDQNRVNLLYYSAPDVFGFHFDSDNSNGLWLKKGGSVGIGTTSPSQKLHVVKSNQALVEVQSTNSGASDTGFTLVTPDRTWNFGQNIGGVGVGNFNIFDVTAFASRMLIDTNGNVGINTTSPAAPLSINGNSYIINGSLGFNRNPSDGTLPPGGQSNSARFQLTPGTDTFMIESFNASGVGTGNLTIVGSSGNVGIGTTSPNAKLQVVGGAIMPEVGNSASAGIYFPTNPGGGGEDEAFIRYYVESGETTKLLIGINNDPDDRLSLYQYGAERLTIYNGNVGIGTTTPTAKLEVNGTIIANGIFPDYSNAIPLTTNTVYQASSNGFLSVVAWGPYRNNLDIMVGINNPPTILIWRMGDDINGNTKGSSALIPIKKGTYYKVLSPGDNWIAQDEYEHININFFPAN